MVDPDKRNATNEFYIGDVRFIELACAQNKCEKGGKLRCPCMQKFMSGYYYWINHGEKKASNSPNDFT